MCVYILKLCLLVLISELCLGSLPVLFNFKETDTDWSDEKNEVIFDRG